MPVPNKKDGWVEDVGFALKECVRIQKELTETNPPYDLRQIPESDIYGHLPHPSGNGEMLCGSAAAQKVKRLAEQALQHSDAVGTLETSRVHGALRKIIIERFVKEKRLIDAPQVEKAMMAAVKAAKQDRADTPHFFPCRLMYAGNPDRFAIGPVTFMTLAKFNEQMGEKFDSYVRRDGSPQDIQLDERLLKDARHYYDGFTWVGQVEVLNCDSGTSKMRGQLAVTAALNFVHVLFGAYHTDRMMVGGPRMDKDRRAHLTIDKAGRMGISTSSSATSAVGFEDGWEKFLEGDSMDVLLRGAGKALEPLVDPAIKRPLGTRLTDAAGWFGDAVREEAPAAQIVKAVTALEALVMADEHGDIASLLSARAAALCYHPHEELTFEELNAIMKRAYDMRSRLAHGSLSPFDAEVSAYAPDCLHWAERVICGGLGLFESDGLLDRAVTRKQFIEGMTGVAEWAKSDSAARAASPR
jgi:hypothetical protein